MLTLIAAHLLAALVAAPLVARARRAGILAVALVPAATFGWLIVQWVATPAVTGGPALVEERSWVREIGLTLSLRLDPLAATVLALVSGVGVLVLVYCAGYFGRQDRTLPTTIAYLVGFAGSMVGLVLADDMYLLFVFWELTTILSFLLIAGPGESAIARRSARQALILTTFGGLAMLVGLVMLADAAGTSRISRVLEAPPPVTPALQAAIGLILLGALTKSALVPWHFWLPNAMAAPTPVSAYLHAAAMVKAGIYLVARFAPVFGTVPLWRWSIVVLGTATLLLGAYRALRQIDLKLLLAFGTVSQLGFITMLFGLGGRTGALAGIGMVIAHGLFKSALFLITGAVDHSTGTRDIRKLSGVRHAHPWLFALAVLAAGSMAGLPPLFGFVAKESALAAVLDEAPSPRLFFVAVVLGSAMTAAYSLRFVWGAFWDKHRAPRTPTHGVGALLVVPPAVAVGGGVLLGPAALLVDPVATAYAAAMPDVSGHAAHLALWHGFNPALAGSVVALLLGLGLFRARALVEAVQERAAFPLGANSLYWAACDTLDYVASRVTAFTQRGSLPQYLTAALLLFVLGPGVVGASRGIWPQTWQPFDHPVQPIAAGIAIAGAVGALINRRRITSALLVGVCGYGVAGLFVLHGAPDIALTQFLVETATTVVAVLALRRLPRVAPRRGDYAFPRHRARVLIATGVGLTMGVLAAVASAGRDNTPVSEYLGPQAKTFGGGYNIVNVTLVDTRAWDTLGEISVLVAAATGVASLIFLRSRGRPRPVVHSSPNPWLTVGRASTDPRRSMVMEVVIRLTFHTMLVFSVYLLFAGHNQPGGGFAGGLVAGLALVTRYLAGGRMELEAAAPFNPGRLLGIGLALAVLSAMAGPVFGGQMLQTAILQAEVPGLGTVKLVTSLFFDVGVYLVVIGLMLDLLTSIGAQMDQQDTHPERPGETSDEADARIEAVVNPSPGGAR